MITSTPTVAVLMLVLDQLGGQRSPREVWSYLVKELGYAGTVTDVNQALRSMADRWPTVARRTLVGGRALYSLTDD
ncbi:hypothetical protein [Actinacidiphila rubida]|uniref:Uncharacterized protein n=1 Tax=Actinacidiphila rubida TaxID=310780 RepID=A0A1H8L8Q1_9ACTN|nr:hypothetical protein [Actinacidiphila rubida]SEO01481.1 hypothetical protein SAMN05216267_101599 [Actinacidiphila rubida]